MFHCFYIILKILNAARNILRELQLNKLRLGLYTVYFLLVSTSRCAVYITSKEPDFRRRFATIGLWVILAGKK